MRGYIRENVRIRRRYNRRKLHGFNRGRMGGSIMKDVKIRKSNGRFESRDKRNYKIGGIILLVGLALLGLGLAIIQAVGWGATHKIMTTAPVKVGFHKPIWVEERQPLVVISPMVEEVMEPLEELTDVDKIILELWGERYFLLARS